MPLRLFLTALLLPVACAQARQPLEIRFDTPPTGDDSSVADFFSDAEKSVSSKWESQAQPVGNGRIGAMIFGLPWSECIQFNDASLWTGDKNPSGDNDRNGGFGAYQNFGELFIRLDRPEKAETTNYSRTLNLRTGIHTTSWTCDGITYQREVFASHPDQIIAIKISATGDREISGAVSIKDAHDQLPTATGNTVSFSGELTNHLRYSASARVLSDTDKPSAEGNEVHFKGHEILILLGAATDYALDPAKEFRSGIDPTQTVEQQLTAAEGKQLELRQRHLDDFTPYMDRTDLDVGPAPDKSIAERLADYQKGGDDPNLEALMFHYGRYLLASCSRDFLPANLQGLWNNSNNPAWGSDYHTNINIEMNYWLAEPANLSDCAMPLFNWTEAMEPETRAAFVKAFGEETPGWTMRTSVNIFGGNGWEWNMPSSAWLAQAYWDHYAFTGDQEFLGKRAWPLFADVSALWLSHLIEKDGKLLAPNGWSPEHGPREDGVAHDQQMIWDLFDNTLAAAKILGKNDEFVAKIASAKDKLLGPQIGSWGQLMEWTTERPELEKSGHRHTSHLFAVYPGHQISQTMTPDFAKAAAISLEARGTSGDSRRSWTWPWRLALWARLHQPQKSAEMMRGLLTYNTMPNLFTTHPPFQIDGNLGITAGICETLVQSQAGEISILPSLLPEWKTGSFKGLKARGGFEVGAAWENGILTSATMTSLLGKPAKLRIHGDPKSITVNGEQTLPADQDGTFLLPTEKGKSYHLTF
ncbi:glycoside hydrolase family 95 protein [Luteolibacter pohnpeiensis]|uniref:Glycoside hydrolase family 95 protein n=1 Tax=Luteolibacter pohnpeiensis TaxID=454153 RepID=A0A934S8U0_9BACT|nr:glycoside hydrolase family 95 protein [Luteolibacter pohnpeiensis]MBK1881484.1 glycoside hydrolase family 95 protein [Luteolibacter pohnpeiensis]